MALDDVSEHAKKVACKTVDDFADGKQFCNRTRISMDCWEEMFRIWGIPENDALKGEIRAIYNDELVRQLKKAGYKDIRQVKVQGKWWYEFYRY